MKNIKKLYTCTSCGFKTLEGVFSEDFCDICNWEESICGMNEPFISPFMHGKTLYNNYQKNILKKIPFNIKEYKIGKNIYYRNTLWKPINEEILDKNHDYFPEFKAKEREERYGGNYLLTDDFKEAQKFNPDDKVHLDL